MKVLTATSTSQGTRDNDYDWTIEGELVWIGLVCATDARDPDGGCGCGRGFSGLNSHKATTTAMIRDLPLDRTDVSAALAGYMDSAGWGLVTAAELQPEVDDLLAGIARWPVGAIVERRLDDLRLRLLAAG